RPRRPFLRSGEVSTARRAGLVVLVGRGGTNVTGHARYGTRRNSARRVLVTQIRLVVVAARRIQAVSLLRQGYGGQAVAIRQNQFAAIDLHSEILIFGIDARC